MVDEGQVAKILARILKGEKGGKEEEEREGKPGEEGETGGETGGEGEEGKEEGKEGGKGEKKEGEAGGNEGETGETKPGEGPHPTTKPGAREHHGAGYGAQKVYETEKVAGGGVKEVDPAAMDDARRIVAQASGVGAGSTLNRATSGGVKGFANLIGDLTEQVLGYRAGSKIHSKSLPHMGVWMPPGTYWQAWQRALEAKLLKAKEKLKPHDITRQLGGMLDVNQALTWRRGNMRIWTRHLPDLTLDMGAHVIFACDATGSMDYPTIELTIAGDEGDKVYYPPGYKSASRWREWLKNAAKEWIVAKRDTFSSEAPVLDESYMASYLTLQTPQGRRITSAGATSGLCWVVAQTMEDIGSEVEIMWWAGYGGGRHTPPEKHDHWVGMVKGREQRMGGYMYTPLQVDGHHENYEAPWIAIERFQETKTPGKIFITISDGQFMDPNDEELYIKGVDALNRAGVVTIMFHIGPMMDAELQAAIKSGNKNEIARLSRHHKYVLGGSKMDAILSKVPGLISEIQLDLARNALKRAGADVKF